MKVSMREGNPLSDHNGIIGDRTKVVRSGISVKMFFQGRCIYEGRMARKYVSTIKSSQLNP